MEVVLLGGGVNGQLQSVTTDSTLEGVLGREGLHQEGPLGF